MSGSKTNRIRAMRQIFFIRFMFIGVSTLILMGLLYSLIWAITGDMTSLMNMSEGNINIQKAISDSYAWRANISNAVIADDGKMMPGPMPTFEFKNISIPSEDINRAKINNAVSKIGEFLNAGDVRSAEEVYKNSFDITFKEYMSSLSSKLDEGLKTLEKSEAMFLKTILFTRLTVIFIFTIIIILLSRTYFYIIKDIVKPILHIDAEVQKLTKGDLKLNAKVDCRNDELTTLGDDLTFAAEELKRYIDAIKLAMNSFKHGDFTIECPIEFLGDFVEIRTSVEDFQDNMSGVLARIDETSSQVYTSAEQVSGVSQNLADGAVTQASTVEELAANINSITEQITQNAENAKQANILGSKTSEVISHGKDEMNELMRAMKEIEKASANIGNIINTIDNIAFQTNILALNAAVEAARAGQAGKGFGVVADEVRSLAQKSAEAAKSTTELIEHSLAAVVKGISLANNTNEAFEQVIINSNEVLEVVDKIAVASKEQAESITHFSMGIEQVSSVVQMNSSTSQESAAASQELSNQATHMKKLIEQFKIKHVSPDLMGAYNEDSYHTSNYSQPSYSKY